jgi:hypothetical protein
MDKETRIKYEKEREAIKRIYPRLQALVIEFGLDYTGSATHLAMENMLTSLRERSKDLTEQLE